MARMTPPALHRAYRRRTDDQLVKTPHERCRMACVTFGPSLATAFPAEHTGTIAVVDLETACELYGRNALPNPLGRRRPVGSVWLATRQVRPIADRLADGELSGVRAWVEALVRADVSVECRVHQPGQDDLRLHAVRAGVLGFVATQRIDDDGVDVVDVFAVAPDALAGVITESVGLVGSGAHHRIAVAGGRSRLPKPPEAIEEYDDLGFLLPRTDTDEPAISVVDIQDVVASGTVQTRDRPARQWGIDSFRRILQWVQVSGDGDYLYEADVGYAEPVTADMLRGFIEGFIADDMEAARRGRGPMSG